MSLDDVPMPLTVEHDDPELTYQEAAIAGFRADGGKQQAVVLDGNRYLFLTNEAEVGRLTRELLTNVLSARR